MVRTLGGSNPYQRQAPADSESLSWACPHCRVSPATQRGGRRSRRLTGTAPSLGPSPGNRNSPRRSCNADQCTPGCLFGYAFLRSSESNRRNHHSSRRPAHCPTEMPSRTPLPSCIRGSYLTFYQAQPQKAGCRSGSGVHGHTGEGTTGQAALGNTEPELLGDAPRELYVKRSIDRAPLGRRHLDARSATNRLTRYRLTWPSVMPFEVEPGARNLLRWTRRFSCREGRR